MRSRKRSGKRPGNATVLKMAATGASLRVVISILALFWGPSLGILEPTAHMHNMLLRDQLRLRHPNNQIKQEADNCPTHPEPVPLPSPLPKDIANAISTLELYLTKAVDKTAVPGIAASVVYRDQVIFSKGFGLKNKTKPDVPDGSTIFRIGSVSKVFVVIMLYQMYERGMVKSLDDPLSKYCPGFSINNPYDSSNITLRQMAAQMSGLPREAPCAPSYHPHGGNLCNVFTKDILERLSNQSLLFPPWSRPSYSNLAFGLLGRCLVATFSGWPYEEYVAKYILAPLNMTNTGFDITDSSNVLPRMATGYLPDGSPAPIYNWGWESPAAQMYSTADDLSKLAQFFYSAASQNGSTPTYDSVLSPALRRQMELPVYVNRDRSTGFGTPWEIYFDSNYTIITKGGNVNGFSALFGYVPELQLGVNVLLSGMVDEENGVITASQIIIPAFVSALSALQPHYPYPPDPNVYTGNYSVDNRGFNLTLTVATDNGQLTLNGLQGPAYLAYREPYKFQIEYPEDLYPCLLSQLAAFKDEWVVFDLRDSSGKSPGVSIPGVYYYFHFQRDN